MTSRPPLGVQQRQAPQRSLSASSTLNQRQAAHNRSIPSHLPSSPIRKENYAPGDFPDNQNHVVQTQYGTPRRGGSRLKLELSNDFVPHSNIIESPGAFDPSKAFTPSRIMPMTDTSDLGDMSSPRTSRGGPTVDNDTVRLPMPKRRARLTLPEPRRDRAAPTPPPTKKDARPKPYAIEVPPAAPRYLTYNVPRTDSQLKSGSTHSKGSTTNMPGTAYADFHPWTGDHAEDKFSEAAIRQGFFEKAPVAQTETSSAKNALFTMLKHKSGLLALSSVFTGILGQRRHSGQINSASTFKPPPRVTLTDTKREVWLKELANPAVPLRKLSRTIPHGIRGKILLEHCLTKNVPTDRAVWLAKCVGANEIRTFKRKGVNGAVVMGGEMKWIRDWTGFVEQFVDTVVSSFGDNDWKAKVNYAVRLATHLYAEYLLDREHYMDWLVSGLENSPHSRLPMWLLITQIYWKDLLRLRKYGRRLVAALLNQLFTIQNNPDRDILAPLSSRLLLLTRSLMTSSLENFIAPSMWAKYRDALHTSLNPDDEIAHASFRRINSRNEQLVSSSVRTQPAVRHILVKLLDGTLQTPISDDFPAKCWNITKDQNALVKTVLEWCTSMYRPGLAKVYIAYRLLTTWSGLGLDTTAALLEFVDMDPLQELERRTAFYHLASELARSGHFHPSRYVQWLIARGGIHDAADVDREGPASSRLLVELPMHALSQSLKSMRSNMLGRASYDTNDEAADIQMAINCVRCTLGIPMHSDNPMRQGKALPIGRLAKRINLSSRALKTAVGDWARQTFVQDMDRAQKEGKGVFEIPPMMFTAVRTILESAEDFQTMAEFMKNITSMSNVELLASCTDTLNLHLATLAALGIAGSLFDVLMGRLKSIVEEQGIAARPLLASLAMLAPRFPGHETLGIQLKQDLIRSDRSTAVDACSPVSDNMAARLQDDEGELHEEIEKLLMNGTSMDRSTMNRLFGTVISKLHVCWDKADDRQRAYSTLLTRLRLFDAQHFDSLMTKWILQIRNSPSRPAILEIFPLLVSVGCLSIAIILATTGDAVSAASRPNPGLSVRPPGAQPSKYAQEVLEMMTVPPSPQGLLTTDELYRFKIMQAQTPKSHLNEMVSLVRNALTEFSTCRSRGEVEVLPLANQTMQNRLMGLLGTLVLTDSSAVSKALSVKTVDPTVGKLIDDITTRLLLPTIAPGTQITFDQVLGLTNEFTLPFCQLKLSQGLGYLESAHSDSQDRMQSHVELFAKAMDNAIDARNITWTGMLPCLSPEITQHLKNRAQARFFDLLPSLKTPPPAYQTLEQSVSMAESLVTVIDTIIRGGSMGRPPQLVPVMVDRLADLWELLGSGEVATRTAVLAHWLPLMLSLLTLHTATFDTSKPSNEVRAKALLVLSGLLQELDSLSPLALSGTALPPHYPACLSQRIFDLALVLVDNLADDARLQCVRVLREATGDPRLRYLFSFMPNPNENLMLAHKDKPTTAGYATQQPSSQTQSADGSQSQSQPQQPQQPQRRGTGFLGANSNAWQWQASQPERLSTFTYRRWEILNVPTQNVGENDTSLSMTLFDAIKLQ